MRAKRMNPAGVKTGLLAKLAGTGFGGSFSGIYHPRRQLAREAFQSRPVLPHDRDAEIRCNGKDRYVVRLLNGVI